MLLAAPSTLLLARSPYQLRRHAAFRTCVAAVPQRELRGPREENAPGDFYVDKTCIGGFLRLLPAATQSKAFARLSRAGLTDGRVSLNHWSACKIELHSCIGMQTAISVAGWPLRPTPASMTRLLCVCSHKVLKSAGWPCWPCLHVQRENLPFLEQLQMMPQRSLHSDWLWTAF